MRVTLLFAIIITVLLAAILVPFFSKPIAPTTTITTTSQSDSMQKAPSPPPPQQPAPPATQVAEAEKDEPLMYPALYICHGGGPLPVLGDPQHAEMVKKWKEHVAYILERYGRPSAIAVVSAHYNKQSPEIGSAPHPAMYYDYAGFPEESYSLLYPAPGAPALANEMVDALQSHGMLASANPERKYDHGVFVPLLMMFPAADIPVVPISVLRSDDPGEHMRMGQALRPFRARGVLFIGSGSSMHHFDYLYTKRDAGKTFNDALTSVLNDTAAAAPLTPAARLEKMRQVEQFPGFSEAHPSYGKEHLMPLMTLLGTAGGRPAKEVANMAFIAANVRHYLFEE